MVLMLSDMTTSGGGARFESKMGLISLGSVTVNSVLHHETYRNRGGKI